MLKKLLLFLVMNPGRCTVRCELFLQSQSGERFMQFSTPFHIHDGIILDCNYKELTLHPARFLLAGDREKAQTFLAQCQKNQVNLQRARL